MISKLIKSEVIEMADRIDTMQTSIDKQGQMMELMLTKILEIQSSIVPKNQV